MRTEKHLQAYFKKKAIGVGVIFHKLESRTARGFPDVGLFYKGRTVLVELKSPKGTGKLSPLQIIRIKELRDQGIEVHVASSKEAVDEIITRLIDA